MRRTALHDYLNQIEGLLDDNRLPEAAAHCHFVLQQYPRHIDTYRLFGRALLEQQLFDEATDVFERLLSADPEDMIAHAGLALAYSESRELERAIWHMERSFEIDPYNRAVLNELKKLYMRRDGDVSPRLSLTRAALGRLQFRAALYRPATLEFTRLLDEHPERLDLQLALADTLFWDARRVEAAELCQKILARLPYCIKANAILADAWLRSDRVDEAREHLRRVQALTLLDRARLDPDTTLGRALSNSRIQLPETVQVEVLDESLTIVQGKVESTSWQEQMSAVVIDGEQVPDWLLEVGSPEGELQDEIVGKQEVEPTGIMDWLEEAAVTELPAPPSEGGREIDTDSSAIKDEAPIPEPMQDMAELELTGGSAIDAFFDDDIEEMLGPEVSRSLTPEDTDESRAGAEPLADIVGGADETDTGVPFHREALDLTESAAGQEKEAKANEPWDDESLMALDDLRSYIDSEDVSESAGVPPEWLGELAAGSDVTDDLPEWLYEAVGLEASESGEAEDQISRQPGKRSQDPSELRPAQKGGSDLKGDEAIEETGTQHARRLGDVSEYEVSQKAEKEAIPDWLLAADDVLEELPAELIDDGKRSHAEMADVEEEKSTWLDELAEQLDDIADERPASDGAEES